MNVQGKVAVVTGAASGIGRALSATLLERECRVVLADIEQDRVASTTRELDGRGRELHSVRCDVSRYEDVEALADEAWRRFGGVDLLFNNAGVAVTASVIHGKPTDLEWLLGVNVIGVWNGCSVFGKRFIEHETPSHIVNTASEHAFGVPNPGQGLYTASKHAILGLSDAIRPELPEHVAISVFCPGVVQSDLWDAARYRSAPLDDAAAALMPITKAVTDRGMPAMEVAAKALDGVERGDFLIVTHPSSKKAADRRCDEITRAFIAQAPDEPGSDRYDGNLLTQSVLAELHGDAEDRQ